VSLAAIAADASAGTWRIANSLDREDAASEADTSAAVFITLIYVVPLKG
jgi:hypothetical protein